MTSPFSDELISAYLDGELTVEQQAHVEKQLGADADLQRMCDELRALRITLQAMPTADAAEDLAERVLRQAERRMLLGEAESGNRDAELRSPADNVPGNATDTTNEATRKDKAHSVITPAAMPRNWRFIASCVATVAALLLVAFTLFNQSAGVPATSEVASGTPSESSSSEANATDSPADKNSWAMDGAVQDGAVQDGAVQDGAVQDGAVQDGEQSAMLDRADSDSEETLELMQKKSSSLRGPLAESPVTDSPADSSAADSTAGGMAGGGIVGDPQHSAAFQELPQRQQEGPGSGGAESEYGASGFGAGYGGGMGRSRAVSGGRPGSSAGTGGGMGGMARPVVPNSSRPNSSRPNSSQPKSQPTGGYGLADEQRGASSARASSAPRGSADSSPGRGGTRRKAGVSLAKPGSKASVEETVREEVYSKSAQSENASQIADQVADPKTLGLAGQEGVSRVEVAQQLVRKLNTDETLLVQVSLPRDVATRFRYSAARPEDSTEDYARGLSEAAELFEAEGLSRVELTVPPGRGEKLQAPQNQPSEHVASTYLVEGAPDDVRNLLQQLVSRSDILVSSVPRAAGQQSLDLKTRGDLKILGTRVLDDLARESAPQPTDAATAEPTVTLEVDDGMAQAKDKLEAGKAMARKAGEPLGTGDSDAGGSQSDYARFGTKRVGDQGESENRDADNRDAGNRDAGNRDAGNRDAGNRDAGNRDAGNRDADNRDADNKGLGSGAQKGNTGSVKNEPAAGTASQKRGRNRMELGDRESGESSRDESKKDILRSGAAPVVKDEREAMKESAGAASRRPASQTDQRRALDRDKDAESSPAEGDTEQTLQQKTLTPPPTAALRSLQAQQPQTVVYFLFRFKAGPALAAPSEASEESRGK